MFSHTSQPCQFERDCPVVMIPAGQELTIPAGTVGYITESLGGSFTVFVDGNLFRVAGIDADAIGKEPMMPPVLAENASDDDVEKLVWAQMKTCYYLKFRSISAHLGLVYSCELKKNEQGQREVAISMTLTAPGCGMGDIIVEDVRSKIQLIPTVGKVDVELTFEPAWNYQMMTEAARLETGML